MSRPELALGARSLVYMHGLGSGPEASKGLALARHFRPRGIEVLLPDLNRPSFATLSVGAGVEQIESLAVKGPLAIVGSSLGGYMAALFAEQHPSAVTRLVLLCPAFDLATRWPISIGEEAMRAWRDSGGREMSDASGAPVLVHYALCEELGKLPERPSPRCETVVVHGRRDEVVPIDTSRAFVERTPHARLVELDDDHRLAASVESILQVVERFLVTGVSLEDAVAGLGPG